MLPSTPVVPIVRGRDKVQMSTRARAARGQRIEVCRLSETSMPDQALGTHIPLGASAAVFHTTMALSHLQRRLVSVRKCCTLFLCHRRWGYRSRGDWYGSPRRRASTHRASARRVRKGCRQIPRYELVSWDSRNYNTHKTWSYGF